MRESHGSRGVDGGDESDRFASPAWLDQQLAACVVSTVRIDQLCAADSPRLAGESPEHIRSLTESASELPPITVHRRTMRVIDGMHRLRAAILRGDTEIEAKLYDGEEAELFIVAVNANVRHGLPLSHADRRAAALRIVDSNAHWSDRMIASIVNLSPSTVAAVRATSSRPAVSSVTRLGRDGRTRPVNTAEGRQLAGDLLAQDPASPLRAVAQATGLSPSTVWDVRERIKAGEDPVPPKQRRTSPARHTGRSGVESRADPRVKKTAQPVGTANSLQRLRTDPSLRLTVAGRTLLRWMDSGPFDAQTRRQIVDRLPLHCLETIADLAREKADAWQRLADELDKRERQQPEHDSTFGSGR